MRAQKRFFAVFAAGVAMYCLGAAGEAHAFASAKFAIQELCGHMMGNLGGLLMTTAGVGAIVSAAFGNFKASYSLIVTGIGAFAISSMLSLYFPAAANECKGGANGGTNRTIMVNMPAAGQPKRALLPEIAIATGQSVDYSKGAQIDLSDPEDQDEEADAAPGEAEESSNREIWKSIADPF